MATAGVLGRYHDVTKHSLASVSADTHRLDWRNKPLEFKIYPTLERIDPPADLGRLCLYSNGVLRWRRYSSGEVYGFRAAPCTGALYHIELYLATAGRPDLSAGLYHYSAHDHGLRRLREGDVRGVLVEASSGFAPLASAPLIIVLTSTFWRNSWKYQARAYRHSYWDSGVILAHLIALTTEDGVPASVVMGFVDAAVNHVVGADGEREVAVAMVAIGEAPKSRSPVSIPPPLGEDHGAGLRGWASLPEINYPTERLSPREVHYPAIVEAHRASSFESADEVAAWRAANG